MIIFDRSVFYDSVRASLFSPSMNQKQVDGMDAILTTWEDDPPSDDLRWLAYMFATTYHETAFTMQPIKEYGSDSYLKGKPYYPYVGRGFVQLTWEDNYRRATTELGLTGSDDLVKYPDRALDPQIASDVMFLGMVQAWFTGKGLPDYFNATVDDPYNARRIINGTDCAKDIEGYHDKFLEALEACVMEVEPVPEPIIPGPQPGPEPEVWSYVQITVACDTPINLVITCGPNVHISQVTPLPGD